MLAVAAATLAFGSLLTHQFEVRADGPRPQATPKVSTFAPAADLASQADSYLQQMGSEVANEEEFASSKEKLAKESNTLIVISLALGLHDQDSKYKATAPAVMKAAQDVAAAAEEALKELPEGTPQAQRDKADARNYAAVKQVVERLQAAAKGQGTAQGELKWARVASLQQLMKQVPSINTKLKRNVKGGRFESQAKKTAGYSAVIAVIAQGSLPNTEEAKAKTPEQVRQWYAFSVELRDAAAAVNAGIHAQDQQATAAAMKKLAQSCENCHAVFKPDNKAGQDTADKDAEK
jgi:cytochrome c556